MDPFRGSERNYEIWRSGRHSIYLSGYNGRDGPGIGYSYSCATM